VAKAKEKGFGAKDSKQAIRARTVFQKVHKQQQQQQQQQ
jgi:hypothetical protein